MEAEGEMVEAGSKYRDLGVMEKIFAKFSEYNNGNFVHSLHFTSTVEISDEQVLTALNHLVK